MSLDITACSSTTGDDSFGHDVLDTRTSEPSAVLNTVGSLNRSIENMEKNNPENQQRLVSF
jgi:hypothetical protein